MNMKKRNNLSRIAAPVLALALTLPAVLPPAAHALDFDAATYAVEPRYTYISRISSRLDIAADGYAACSGGFSMFKGMDVTLTITLEQKSTGGR